MGVSASLHRVRTSVTADPAHQGAWLFGVVRDGSFCEGLYLAGACRLKPVGKMVGHRKSMSVAPAVAFEFDIVFYNRGKSSFVPTTRAEGPGSKTITSSIYWRRRGRGL